jgi:hypothetical protein
MRRRLKGRFAPHAHLQFALNPSSYSSTIRQMIPVHSRLDGIPHHMRFLPLILLITATVCPGARAQTTTDTLDWHRYFPLEIGNEWHYRDAEGFPVTRFAITGDTLVDGMRWYRAEEAVFERLIGRSVPTLVSERALFLRHDDSGRMIEREDPAAESGAVFSRGLQEFDQADLTSAFGTTTQQTNPDEPAMIVTGGYDHPIRIGPSDLIVPAVKRFAVGPWMWSYAADIGFLGGGNLWGPELAYARVGGTEYGSMVVSREARPVTGHAPSRALFFFPNPARDMVNVVFESAGTGTTELEIYDLSGKLVARHDLSDSWSAGRVIARIDVSLLLSGAYLARVRSGERVTAAGSFVVWR